MSDTEWEAKMRDFVKARLPVSRWRSFREWRKAMKNNECCGGKCRLSEIGRMSHQQVVDALIEAEEEACYWRAKAKGEWPA